MKKLFIILLFLSSLASNGQSVIAIGDTVYYPRVADNGTVYRQVGYGLIKPTNYSASKQYPVVMNIHGIGELSEGKLANLRNVVQGFDYGSGVRQYAIATDDFKKAVNLYGFIGIVPTYGNNLSVSDINFILDEVEKNWSVDRSREALIGFSLGGGAVVRYMTSSLANARRISLAVPCSPVDWATTLKNVVDANLQVIGATNRTDGRVSPENIKRIASGINALNPAIPADLIIFPEDGHGSVNRMLALSDPSVPQSIYAYLLSISNASPKPYPTSTTAPPVVVPPPTGGPVIKLVPVNITTTGTVSLEACESTGYSDFTWNVFSVPKGANPYTPYLKGSGYCRTTAVFTIEGAYGIKAQACKGTVCVTDTLYITYQKTSVPVPHIPKSFSNGLLLFSDGSTEQGTVTGITADKKITVKTTDGTIYEF